MPFSDSDKPLQYYIIFHGGEEEPLIPVDTDGSTYNGRKFAASGSTLPDVWTTGTSPHFSRHVGSNGAVVGKLPFGAVGDNGLVKFMPDSSYLVGPDTIKIKGKLPIARGVFIPPNEVDLTRAIDPIGNASGATALTDWMGSILVNADRTNAPDDVQDNSQKAGHILRAVVYSVTNVS